VPPAPPASADRDIIARFFADLPAPRLTAQRARPNSRMVEVCGRPTRMFTISALAAVLNRSPVTIRRWERLGIFPTTPFYFNAGLIYVNRRFYTEPMLHAVAEIAGRYRVSAGRMPCQEFYQAVSQAFTQEHDAASWTHPAWPPQDET